MDYLKILSELQWPLKTERLYIRPLTVEDKPKSFEISCSESAAKWCDFTVPQSIEMYNYDWAISNKFQEFGMFLLETDTLVGHFSFRLDVQNHKASLGYVAHPSFIGKGYIPEAGANFLDIAFLQLRLNRIESCYEVGNKSSKRVMEKLGMRFEGHFVDEVFVKGKFRTMEHYAILRREWLEQKAANNLRDIFFKDALTHMQSCKSQGEQNE